MKYQGCEFYKSNWEKGVTDRSAIKDLESLHWGFVEFLQRMQSSSTANLPESFSDIPNKAIPTHKKEELSEGEIADDDNTDPSEQESLHPKQDKRQRRGKRSTKHQSKLLDKDLKFNVKGEKDKHCQCKVANTLKWPIHSAFFGEKATPRCCPTTNNSDRLWCYRLVIYPNTNFKARTPTYIKHNGRRYYFQGFYLLSHFPLPEIPCTFVHYHREYRVQHLQEEIPRNFCIRDLDLFQKYVFDEVLEMYNWKTRALPEDSCPIFHLLPRFIHTKGSSPGKKSDSFKPQSSGYPTNPKKRYRDGSSSSRECYAGPNDKNEATGGRESCEELLSMKVVLEHLMKSYKPLLEAMPQEWSSGEWKDLEKRFRGSIVAAPGKKPRCVRLDGLEIHEKESREKHRKKISCTMLHISAIPSRKPSDKSSTRKYIKIYMSAQGVYRTGIYTDVVQHLIPLYFIMDHFRYHKSLSELEERIEYVFKNRSLLHVAMMHSSINLDVLLPVHLKVVELNCGIRDPSFGACEVYKLYRKEKGMDNLSKVMDKLAEPEECSSNIRQNESLEFLGDAVLEFVTSRHLFFLFGELSEGALNTFRCALVQNKFLTEIAKRLGLEHFMYFGHGLDSFQQSFDQMLGNCVEALLGAVYLDGGFEEVEKLIRNILFEEEDLRRIWETLPNHHLQARAPDGDRYLIPKFDFLQKFVKLEESIGIEFTHICLLAKAFVLPSAAVNSVIGGNSQRMEYFGDSIIKFIISDYLFKHFPDHQEGHLTLLRTSLVNSKCQATAAEELGLHDFVIHGSVKVDFSTTHMKKLADTFEAFIAAVFVDKGFEYCKKICEVCLISKLKGFIISRDWLDPKSLLQHHCFFERDKTKRKENPVYKVLETTGTTENKQFRVSVSFKGKRIGTGIGKSIQGAEKDAAKNALDSNYQDYLSPRKRNDTEPKAKRRKTDF